MFSIKQKYKNQKPADSNRRAARCVLLLMLLLATAAPTLAQDADFVEITPQVRQSVDRGLRVLASLQNDDGSWGGERYGRHAGITGIAAMAFMADGNLPGRGPYASNVEKALDFVLAAAGPSGLIAADTSHGPMYGHGYATLFLAEVYGESDDPRVHEALLKAVRLIVRTQNPEGGWRYHPVPDEADISVTITQVMALRAARNAGISVPRETIDRAIQYVRNCQNSDGGFRYMLSPGPSQFARSAAGLATLYYAGVYEGEPIDRGLAYLTRLGFGITGNAGGHFHYGQYYASQAMFHAGGTHWASYYPQIRDGAPGLGNGLLLQQQADGTWNSAHGAPYGTGMSLLVLMQPYRLVPIYQR